MIFQMNTLLLVKWKKLSEKGFKKGLNIELKPLELTEAQLAEVEELTEKYRSDEWMFRKCLE